MNFLFILFTLGTHLNSESSKEIPREHSISLMLPAKFGKRGGDQYCEFSNAGAISMNFCKDPTAEILRSKHFIVMGKYESGKDYFLSIGIGGSLIDQMGKKNWVLA